MSKPIIQSVREYFINCEVIEEIGGDWGLDIDELSSETINFGILTSPVEPVITQYIDGSSMRQYVFDIASSFVYGGVYQNIENKAFYEKMAEWIESNSREGNLPKLEGNRKAQRLEVLTGEYVTFTEKGLAQYVIPVRLVYRQGRNR